MGSTRPRRVQVWDRDVLIHRRPPPYGDVWAVACAVLVETTSAQQAARADPKKVKEKLVKRRKWASAPFAKGLWETV